MASVLAKGENMKRIAIACIIAVLLCGCNENPKNTNDEKSEMTRHSEDSLETSSETAATENTTTENIVTENVTSRTTENKHETVSATVSTEKSSNDKEFVVTEKIEKKTETTTTENDNIPPNTTTSTTVDTTQKSEETTVLETKQDVIELPFVPVG